ncbi:radical SAM protein [Bacillus sp. 165]|uniref:radical SAM protein n=1 Tax=Bacillus sp. 165 TaxID=1529117 RepID=UPI001ADB0788|nr:radical SAM protein [Bacillus sp. 165]
MEQFFTYDERLGILIPAWKQEWEDIPVNVQNEILLKWEQIRGRIPDRIKELEHGINMKQHELSNEINFEKSCLLNSQIADLASIINDLWLWYRTNQNISTDKMHQ